MKYKYFTDKELSCKCGCDKQEMNSKFMKSIGELRELYGKPLIVTSAYRCPEHNNKVSSTGLNGPHTTGKAIDFLISRQDAYDLLFYAIGMQFSGLGINQKGTSRFIHIDDLTDEEGYPIRPTIWSY